MKQKALFGQPDCDTGRKPRAALSAGQIWKRPDGLHRVVTKYDGVRVKYFEKGGQWDGYEYETTKSHFMRMIRASEMIGYNENYREDGK